MFSRKKIGCVYLLLTMLVACPINTNAREFICTGHYKGRSFTRETLKPILTAHQKWLQAGAQPSIKGRANLCGTDLHGINLNGVDLSYADLSGADIGKATLQKINLSHANLYKTYFFESDLSEADLQKADLEEATLKDATLQSANLRIAQLMKASLTNANLRETDLRSANLTDANMSDTNLNYSDLSWANLSQANLSNANLKHANFTEATLINTDLSLTTLQDANFSQANLKNALFQPVLGGLPDLVSLATSKNFRTIQFPDVKGTAALIELRSAYKKIGIRTMERTITAMVKVKQMKQAWSRGGWGYLESMFSYIFFYLPSDFGAAPGRALFSFLLFIFLFAIPYYLSLSIYLKRSGIRVIWHAREKSSLSTKAQACKEPLTLRKILKEHESLDWRSKSLEHLRFARIALYFSLITAFSIGWRELNVSNWILRLQKRDYKLQGFGWVRVLAGSQSLLSAYLIVLWALTYFGRPFEW